MPSVLATLPLHLGLQIILTGHPSVTRNVNLVGYESPRPLPKGYVKFPENNAAYKIYEIYLTWIEAQEHCRSDGGHLAIADSRDIIQRINSTKPHPTRWAHGGIHRSSNANNWLRVDSGHVTFVPWAKSANHSEDCTLISMSEGGIIDVACNLASHFVCEISITEDEVLPVATFALPDGYVLFNRSGIAYKIHTELLSWNEARKECIREGGNLAVIDSRQKNYDVIGMERPDAELHIGIHNKFNTAEWMRADNNRLVRSIPWAPSNPKREGKCLFLGRNGRGAWNGDCEFARSFVCEISIPIQENEPKVE